MIQSGYTHVYGFGTISVSANQTLAADCPITGSGTLSYTVPHADFSGEGSLVCNITSVHLTGEGTLTLTMLLAWSIHDIQNMIVDLSDREIYNDIRAECDLTEIIKVDPDEMPEWFERFRGHGYFYDLPAHETVYVEVYPQTDDHTEITWLDITEAVAVAVERDWTQEECEALGGDWYPPFNSFESVCNLPAGLSEISAEIIDRDERSCTVEVRSESDYNLGRGHIYIDYLCLTPETRFLNLSAVDPVSMAKYGRRSMDLVWPLGQYPDDMQEILDLYLEKYKEPVPFLNISILGKTETLQERIARSEINDRFWIISDTLEMDEEFWLNNINCVHEVQDCLRANFDLEQIRDMER